MEGADTLARVPGSPPLWRAGSMRTGTMSRIVLLAGPCVLTLPPLPALADRCIPPCHAQPLCQHPVLNLAVQDTDVGLALLNVSLFY